MDVRYVTTLADLRAWIDAYGAAAEDLWLGFSRVRFGAALRPSLTVAVAASALADLGWVECERAVVDDDRYAVRFAPGTVRRRRAPQNWHDGPVEMPALDPAYEDEFRSDVAAWTFFEAQSPRYRRVAIWWVTSGKAEATRRRRLDALIEGSAAGERLAQLQRQL